MTASGSRVFFSYAREDSEFVLKLATDLRAAGASLWIDQLDIAAGERWDEAVESALRASPSLLVVLSPESVASQNVMDEVAYALENGKRVVPVLRAPCEIPFRLRRVQYVDFTASYRKGLEYLLGTLNAPQDPGAPPPAKSQGGRRTSRPRRRFMVWIAAGVLAAVVGVILYGVLARSPLGDGTERGDFPGPSPAADECLPGFVWRQTIPSDHVCVTEASRQQVELENQRAAERRRSDGGGRYGPDECLPGYVWREAFDGDTICVSVARRQQIQEENALAQSRVRP